MKRLLYKGYKISRIARCGCRRVIVAKPIDDKYEMTLKSWDGYNMENLIDEAKRYIDHQSK